MTRQGLSGAAMEEEPKEEPGPSTLAAFLELAREANLSGVDLTGAHADPVSVRLLFTGRTASEESHVDDRCQRPHESPA